MTRAEMNGLGPGDTIKHKGFGITFMVAANYGDRVTAVRTCDVTNWEEWEVVVKRTVMERT